MKVQRLEQWFTERHLDKVLSRERIHESGGWLWYRYSGSFIPPGATWERMYHGTWWYGLRMILQTGVIAESGDASKGHWFMPGAIGVYSSPHFELAAKNYARPHVLFGNGEYHRVVVELRVDPTHMEFFKRAKEIQSCAPGDVVSINGIWVLQNSSVAATGDRIDHWDREHEAVPC